MQHYEAEEILETLKTSKIGAIQLLRRATGMGLLQSKDYLEQSELKSRMYVDFVKSWEELIEDIDRQIRELQRQRLEYLMQRDEDRNWVEENED